MSADERLRPAQRYAAEAKQSIDDMLDLLDHLKLKRQRVELGGAAVSLAEFSPGVLILDDLARLTTNDELFCGPDTIEAAWPIHSRVVMPKGMVAVHTVTARETRGRVRYPMGRMIRISHALLQGKVGYTTTTFYGIGDDDRMVNLTNIAARTFPVDPVEINQIYLAAGWAINMQYEWSVDIRRVGREFSLRIPTSPAGARKLLSLRDVEPGRERRRALRHWVSDHARVVGTGDSERTVDVSEHLRGKTPFKWEDYEGVVRPAPHDLARLGVAPAPN